METGFFVMLDLSFREGGSVETYVEMRMTTDNEFLSKVVYRRIGYILYESITIMGYVKFHQEISDFMGKYLSVQEL